MAVVLMVVAFGADVLYLVLAQHRFYREPFRKAAIRAPLIYGGYFVVYLLLYQAAMILAAVSSIRTTG
jgi:hypothetical protein